MNCIPDDCNFPCTEAEREALTRVRERLNRTIEEQTELERLRKSRGIYDLAAMAGLNRQYRNDLVHAAWCIWQGVPHSMTPTGAAMVKIGDDLAKAYLAAEAA